MRAIRKGKVGVNIVVCQNSKNENQQGFDIFHGEKGFGQLNSNLSLIPGRITKGDVTVMLWLTTHFAGPSFKQGQVVSPGLKTTRMTLS